MPLRICLQTKDTGNSSKSFKQKSDPTCNFEKSALAGYGTGRENRAKKRQEAVV